MPSSLGKTPGSFSGETPPKTSTHSSTDSLVDFVQARAIRYQQKELARITGLSLKQIQNLRLGRSGVSGKTLTNWAQNDPRFAVEYGIHIGLIKPEDADIAYAMTMMANAVARRQAKDGAE